MKTTNTEELKQNGDFAKTLVWYIQHANSTEEAEEHVRRFLTSKIAQAIAEERERVRAKTKGVRDSLLVYFHNAVNDQKAPYRHAIQAIEEEILSSLDTPLPE